tara:strand:+ start:2238 stop:2717 length:480 start_codon:yes stop_codon:yes gene_type:complete
MEKTRSEWEPRGNTVHACLEAFLLGLPYDPGAYKEWVEPLLAYDLWNRWEPVAVEFRMADTRYCIAGSADCILRHKENGKYALADLKTLSKSGRKRDISAQLGGYLSLLSQCKPEIQISKCFGIWAKPNETFTTRYDPIDCRDIYDRQRHYFLKQQPQI